MAHESTDPGVPTLVPGTPEEAIFRAMEEIYARTLAGEIDAVTALMHPEVTLWDSEIDALALGVPHLLSLRERQLQEPLSSPDAELTLSSLDASEPYVSVWGDTALMRHRLTVRFSEAEAADIHIRNTSAWRLHDGQWLMVHNHEDVWPTP